MELKGKRTLVLGLGDTGMSMAAWLHARGADVLVADTRARPPRLSDASRVVPQSAIHLGGFDPALFEDIDLLAISPGIALTDPAVSRLVKRGVPVVGDIELLAQALGEQSAPARVIAVTGTNGKSTVTALAGAMCRACGLDCEVAGNIGPAVLDAYSRRQAHGGLPEAWVLELSSFQLETTSCLRPDAATMLNLTDDHLDRHGSMDGYARAKARIFRGSGVQVLNRDDPYSLSMAVPGRVVATFGAGAPKNANEFGLVREGGELWLSHGKARLMAASELKLAGLHNATNALAALALCRALDLPWEPLLTALRDFRGLPHRVEFAGEVNGVRYYDDSKGTNVGATVAALAGLGAGGTKIVLIAGGEGKGQDFSPLAEPVRSAARSVVLIGRDAVLIEHALSGTGVPIRRASDIEAAIDAAASDAAPGDCVLLSPACASFDMFRDYRHRGEVFKAAVQRRLGAAR